MFSIASSTCCAATAVNFNKQFYRDVKRKSLIKSSNTATTAAKKGIERETKDDYDEDGEETREELLLLKRRTATRMIVITSMTALMLKENDRVSHAMFNSGLDEPIEDSVRAIAVVLAVKVALGDILKQNEDFRLTCDAPVYSCDLSQLNVKCATRVSGPINRSLPTILNAYGLDAYEVEAIKQSIQELETVLKANNARVAVNFKSPADYLQLIQRQIDELLEQIPSDVMDEARALFNSCDLAVPAENQAELDCRINRAVKQGKRPSGGVS
jgi:hypothetical protein